MDWFIKRRDEKRLGKWFGKKAVKPVPIPLVNIVNAMVEIAGNKAKPLRFETIFSTNINRIDKPNASKPFNSAFSFVSALEKKGFKSLGAGAYSTVLGKEGSNKVIKIGHRPASDGWFGYVKWANENGWGGTFAPKLFSYKLIKGKNETFYIASMERLVTTVDKVRDKCKVLPAISVLSHMVYDSGPHVISYKIMLNAAFPKFGDFAEALTTKFAGENFDFHSGNWMLRADNDNIPVGIDLISSNSHGESINRYKAAA